ncbi:hypothetical protein D1007_35131 [Hordeum vulgare]|nr:hypothetical protein D1007_35131 [Hordeum vulgare]
MKTRVVHTYGEEDQRRARRGGRPFPGRCTMTARWAPSPGLHGQGGEAGTELELGLCGQGRRGRAELESGQQGEGQRGHVLPSPCKHLSRPRNKRTFPCTLSRLVAFRRPSPSTHLAPPCVTASKLALPHDTAASTLQASSVALVGRRG